MKDGELWFDVRYNIAPTDGCRFCGGTGKSHYNPFVACTHCSKDYERETNFVHKNILVGVNVRKDAL